jgi:hypothetical protein
MPSFQQPAPSGQLIRKTVLFKSWKLEAGSWLLEAGRFL